MSAVPAMKLVDENEAAQVSPVRLVESCDPSPTTSILPIEHQLEKLQRDLLAVTTELAELRQRDDTLKFYTHRLDEELRLAARVQQDFLPRSLPSVERLRFSALYRPAGFVS